MKYLGAHVSAAGGLCKVFENALKIKANAFAMFVKNQRRWSAKSISDKESGLFKACLAKSGISADKILPHDSYLINLGHPDSEKNLKSFNAFVDEAARVEKLGLSLLNFHPGSTLKEISVSECLKKIALNINKTHEKCPDIILLIENTAGQGSQVGASFSEIAEIISLVEDKQRVGVCLDTCHAFQAGYDLSAPESIVRVFKEFDQVIGLEYLKAMHLNDSLREFNKRVDRHASLGNGFIGLEAFQYMMQLDFLDNMPLILETPDDALWSYEIEMLRKAALK